MKIEKKPVSIVTGEESARYGFGDGHPFGPDRQGAFMRGLRDRNLEGRVEFDDPPAASRDDIGLFHTDHHIGFVEELSALGEGYLDSGDLPVFPGIYELSAAVVGAALRAGELVMSGMAKRAFAPIAGLHHASRERTSGFCVFNDCAVLIEALRSRHGLKRIAYVDIDAHHGDGVYNGFASDPDILFADVHEDGRFLFPGTGAREETGEGAAIGTKLNFPLMPGSGDDEFRAAWREIELYLNESRPELIILQCGADSMDGDPLTHLKLSENAHGMAAASLCEIADRHADGRLIALGGGGYNRDNIATGWSRVVSELIDAS
jgi:acetoin utilization protein AcuC